VNRKEIKVLPEQKVSKKAAAEGFEVSSVRCKGICANGERCKRYCNVFSFSEADCGRHTKLDIVHIDELLGMTDEDRKIYLDDLRKHKSSYTRANKVWAKQYAEDMKKRMDEFFKDHHIDFSAKTLERSDNAC
jgi:hypothetical protein